MKPTEIKPTQVSRNSPLERFGLFLEPADAIEPILTRSVRDALTEWLTEIWHEEELAAVGLTPRRKALFVGPPGVGKTTLAHHLAARLGLPLLVVASEMIIDSFIGASARNIGVLFAAAAEAADPVILFFDEFDSLAQARRSASQGSEDERNSWVNTLLQRIENHAGFVIAASNRPEAIDKAIWRRFEMQIALEVPGAFERRRILARYLAPYVVPDHSLDVIAEAFAAAAPALIEAFALTLKRQLVLGPKLQWPMVKEATIGRVLASIEPHPDAVRPPLWSDGLERKKFLLALPWPLELATEGKAA